MADTHASPKFPFAWDYNLDAREFVAILLGQAVKGRLDADWAALRLLEYGAYKEIVQLMGFKRLIVGWPRWRKRVRSVSRRRGLDFLVEWLPKHHPEMLA